MNLSKSSLRKRPLRLRQFTFERKELNTIILQGNLEQKMGVIYRQENRSNIHFSVCNAKADVSDTLFICHKIFRLLINHPHSLKPSLPCSFHITKPRNCFATSNIIFSRLKDFATRKTSPEIGAAHVLLFLLEELAGREFETIFLSHHVDGQTQCGEDEQNYHTRLRFERTLYLTWCRPCTCRTAALFTNFSLSLLHLRLQYCFLSSGALIVSSFFLPNMSIYLLKPIILVHNTLILKLLFSKFSRTLDIAHH